MNNSSVKKLMKIAELIKDKELRDKTITLLKNIKISNKHFKKYKKIDIGKAFAAPSNFHHAYEGGLVDHTVSVASLCIEMAKKIEENYKININKDTLISAAVLHDIMKVFCFKKTKGLVVSVNKLDHGIWACCELYLRDFPEDVIDIIASHFGPNGPNPPKTIEALILFYADNLDTMVDSIVRPKKENAQIIFMGSE